MRAISGLRVAASPPCAATCGHPSLESRSTRVSRPFPRASEASSHPVVPSRKAASRQQSKENNYLLFVLAPYLTFQTRQIHRLSGVSRHPDGGATPSSGRTRQRVPDRCVNVTSFHLYLTPSERCLPLLRYERSALRPPVLVVAPDSSRCISGLNS